MTFAISRQVTAHAVCFRDFLCQIFTFWRIKSKAVNTYQTYHLNNQIIITELEIAAKKSNFSTQILLKRSQSTVKFDFLGKTITDLPHFSLFHFAVSS